MKVVILSQYYDPEPVYIPATVARGLASRGHEVTVITGFPNYPAGALYPGYIQRPWRKEQDGLVNVIRTPLWVSHSENPLGRIANYISFALSSLVVCMMLRRIDVMYVYGAQMTAALGPSIRRAFFATPYVLHVQDLWPESVTGSSMVSRGKIAHMIGVILNPFLRLLYGQATATVAIAPTMSKILVDRGVPSDRIEMVYNWANESPAQPGAASSLAREYVEPSEGLLVAYAGNLGDHQDLETVIRAAKAVEGDCDIEFELYGAGMAKERLVALAEELEVSNVTFCGSIAAGDMAKVYDRADFQLVTLRDREIFRGTIPSKFQACLFHSAAVLTNVVGDVADICSSAGLGLSCSPESVMSMADMFRGAAATSPETRRAMAGNGYDFYLHHMSEEQGINALEQILIRAAARGKR